MRFLVGDIGGTKTVLALYELNNNKLSKKQEKRFPSKDHKSLEDIIQLFLPKDRKKIDAACFGIAGPIKNQMVKTTNLPWVIQAKKIQKKFSCKKVFLINDLLANAYGLSVLKPKQFFCLHKGKKNKKANQALISAGTGLGEASLFFTGDRTMPSPSEGGHTDFSPRDKREVELFFYLQKRFGHVSWERVLSGQGFCHLYEFLESQGYKKQTALEKKLLKEQDMAKVITELGLKGKSALCKETVDWFVSLYGAEAGNFALKIMAKGGVYLGGGIAPKILPALKKKTFLQSFLQKGRFRALLKDFPIYVVLEEKTALLGSLQYCRLHALKSNTHQKSKTH